MQLILDHREGKLKELFQNNLDIKLDYQNLDYGDFCIFNNENPFIIIERKTLDDLSSSIIDGRYKEQKQKKSNNKTQKLKDFKLLNCF